jgi:LuxR family maltose regulon positive regulatory protein
MQKNDPLIRAKLRMPFTRSDLVSRPRLQTRITEGLRYPLTLVIAPAGFGKTTLVASTLAGCCMQVAWLSLDRDDNQDGRFITYLIAALQGVDHRIGSDAALLMAGMQQVPSEGILTRLINDLETANREMILVLDDYQFIKSQAVHEGLAFLLEHCPPTFHLLISTRSDPPFPLARLRARGQMVELRTADLCFTDSEGTQFLNVVMGLSLDAGSITVLEERTEGWIAGLQMAALSMRGRKDAEGFIREFAGTNRFIMDFMLEEVLAHEPEDVQTFLLQTAVLTRLNGPLCDSVTGTPGSQEMLENLERRNLFVLPLDDERRWYRYHQLFADLLQAKLNESGRAQSLQLQSRAAEWCEQDGQFAEAVNYALAAQNHPLAATLIAKYWNVAAITGEIETAWSWLNALPEGMVRNSAALGIACCWVLWLKGQVGAIESHLTDAENALDKQAAADGRTTTDAAYAELSTQFAALQAIVARHSGNFEAAGAHAERALSLIPGNLPPQVNAQLRALIFLALASAYDGSGDLEKAVNAYYEIIRFSQLSRNPTGLGVTIRLSGALRVLGRLRAAGKACCDSLEYMRAQGLAKLPAAGVLHVALSEVLVERNELEDAKNHLSKGIELGKWSGRLDAVKNAAYALSRMRQARNDPSGVFEAIQEAESDWDEPPSPLAKAELLGIKARILVRQGSLGEAAKCAEEAVQLTGQDRGQTRELVDLASSRVMFAQSSPDEAAAQLTRSIKTAEERGRLGSVIELSILCSLALVKKGDTKKAEADLERALAIAEPEGYIRVFLDEGQPMQMLIAQWLAHSGENALRDYAIRLLSQFDVELHSIKAAQAKTSPTGDLVEPLSQRELEVLHLMATGMTNQEIARQLVVARGTVKAHTASIYRKLDTANRTEAAARARQLGILP